MDLKEVTSAGCIIIKDNKVLLVYSHFWGFPKGHLEEGESEKEAAIREVKEEVGLDVSIVSDKRYVIDYTYSNKYGNIKETSIYYKAYPLTDEITRQESEINKVKWCSFKEALDLMIYDNLKDMFNKFLIDEKLI